MFQGSELPGLQYACRPGGKDPTPKIGSAGKPSLAAKQGRVTTPGFTQIELLVVLAIVALLMGSATPLFASLARHQQADAYIYTLQRAVNSARIKAISTRKIVSLCPYSNSGCGDDWQQGIMLFTDPNNDGILDSDERLIAVFSTLIGSKRFSLQWKASGGKNYLRFSPTGMARQFGKFHLCSEDDRLEYARSLVLNRQGRSRRYRDTDQDGIVDDGNGNQPIC